MVGRGISLNDDMYKCVISLLMPAVIQSFFILLYFTLHVLGRSIS